MSGRNDILWTFLPHNMPGRREVESSYPQVLWSVVSHHPQLLLSSLSLAPCVVPHISHGYVDDRASGSSVGHNQSIAVQCLSQFQPTTNLTTLCNNGTWSSVPKCIPAKCTELPTAPRNGMVVAPNLDHGMVGKFEVSLVSIKIVL